MLNLQPRLHRSFVACFPILVSPGWTLCTARADPGFVSLQSPNHRSVKLATRLQSHLGRIARVSPQYQPQYSIACLPSTMRGTTHAPMWGASILPNSLFAEAPPQVASHLHATCNLSADVPPPLLYPRPVPRFVDPKPLLDRDIAHASRAMSKLHITAFVQPERCLHRRFGHRRHTT
jgi:hypothetical protein